MDGEIAVHDLRGLKCPLPALMARRALLRAEPGASIAFISDDPLASIDVPHMCAQEGFEVISVTREGSAARMVLRRRAAQA
jgi:tRNA 2-thiouridine synthesizing protein A